MVRKSAKCDDVVIEGQPRLQLDRIERRLRLLGLPRRGGSTPQGDRYLSSASMKLSKSSRTTKLCWHGVLAKALAISKPRLNQILSYLPGLRRMGPNGIKILRPFVTLPSS